MLPSGISVRIREDLLSGAARTQTTLVVDPLVTITGHRVAMTDIGDKGYGKLEQGTTREELMSWTGITDNGATMTLTGCEWGINLHNLTSGVNTNKKRHVIGSSFKITTDMHFLAEQYRDKDSNLFESSDDFDIKANTLKLGDGTSTSNKVLKAQNGDANEPFIEYNETTGKWNISNDGVNSYDPEQGGSGVTAGEAISIVGGVVNVKTKEASAIHITDDEVSLELQTNPGLEVDVDNKLGVKTKENTGLLKDADGIYCDSIDPDNIQPQSAGYLVGGTGVSALSVFSSLGTGANNGKIKANVDGSVYDNVPVDLASAVEQFITQDSASSGNTKIYLGNPQWQSFLTTATRYSLTKVSCWLRKWQSITGDLVVEIYLADGSQNPTGSALATATIPVSSISGTAGWVETALNITLSPSTRYCLKLSATGGNSGNDIEWYYGNDVYAGGQRGGQPAYDYAFRVSATGYDLITTALQTAIRTATSKTETVVWSTDHFVITSATVGRDSKILKLMSPSTGTDISGAGATPYLDMADNATEIQGTGDDYKLVRLDESGQIPLDTIITPTYYIGDLSTLDTTSPTTNNTLTVSITADCGFIPRYFEALIQTGVTDARTDYNSNQNSSRSTMTMIVKGIVNGSFAYVYSVLPANAFSSPAPFYNPYGFYDGSYKLSYSGYGSSGPQITASNSSARLLSVTNSGTLISFNFQLIVGANNGVMRNGVRQLVVIK